MSEKRYILKKEEAYTFHEMCFVRDCLLKEKSESLQKNPQDEKILENLNKLCDSLSEAVTTTAIFFMPKTTYDLFSSFQGQNAVCMVDVNDVESWYAGVEKTSDEISAEWKKHLLPKISVLLNHLKNGNQVVPVVIQADNLLLLNS